MVIRNWLDWYDYVVGFSGDSLDTCGKTHVPFEPPSFPCIVYSLELGGEDDPDKYISHSFYTVEDLENPNQASEYMDMLEDYPDFVQAVEEDLAFSLIEDSSKGI